MKRSKKPMMSEEEYLATNLKEMDEMEKRWYMNEMKTWTDEDYDNYTKFNFWMEVNSEIRITYSI